MVMAVGTVGCGVVDLCGSESTILIAFVVSFVVAYKNRKSSLLEWWYWWAVFRDVGIINFRIIGSFQPEEVGQVG